MVLFTVCGHVLSISLRLVCKEQQIHSKRTGNSHNCAVCVQQRISVLNMDERSQGCWLFRFIMMWHQPAQPSGWYLSVETPMNTDHLGVFFSKWILNLPQICLNKSWSRVLPVYTAANFLPPMKPSFGHRNKKEELLLNELSRLSACHL